VTITEHETGRIDGLDFDVPCETRKERDDGLPSRLLVLLRVMRSACTGAAEMVVECTCEQVHLLCRPCCAVLLSVNPQLGPAWPLDGQ
jgi:hypothetical protein